ncbi:GGDEF domain-containing protein [Catellatospora sichuanensis]|uniref:GGDEF domain-containing protein n=1 Tax=Catellatospora sichuanensis TaxID=1969805 RepID=UPI001184248E|nr:GGDEF domain-containing protein [Catellatospora sichuanensis]
MSELISMIATFVAALALGRLAGVPPIRRLRRQLADAVRQINHDPLTGLLSRAGLTAAHAMWQREQQQLILVLLDLDDFKSVNDTYGHQAGDDLLIEIADSLGEAAHLYGGVAARQSGDEFAVLLPIRSDIQRAVDAIIAITGLPVSIAVEDVVVKLVPSASAGACTGAPSETLDTLLRRADIALYRAKQSDRPYAVYEAGMAMPQASARRGPRRRDRREHGGAAR